MKQTDIQTNSFMHEQKFTCFYWRANLPNGPRKKRQKKKRSQRRRRRKSQNRLLPPHQMMTMMRYDVIPGSRHRPNYRTRTYVWRTWLMELIKHGYSLNVVAWLTLHMAIWGIVKNPDDPSKRWKEGCRLVIALLYSCLRHSYFCNALSKSLSIK